MKGTTMFLLIFLLVGMVGLLNADCIVEKHAVQTKAGKYTCSVSTTETGKFVSGMCSNCGCNFTSHTRVSTLGK